MTWFRELVPVLSSRVSYILSVRYIDKKRETIRAGKDFRDGEKVTSTRARKQALVA